MEDPFVNGSFQRQMIAILSSNNGRCFWWKFLDLYLSSYGPIPLHQSGKDLKIVVSENYSDVVEFQGDLDILILKSCLTQEEQYFGKRLKMGGNCSGECNIPVLPISPPSKAWGSGIAGAASGSSSARGNAIEISDTDSEDSVISISSPDPSGFISFSENQGSKGSTRSKSKGKKLRRPRPPAVSNTNQNPSTSSLDAEDSFNRLFQDCARRLPPTAPNFSQLMPNPMTAKASPALISPQVPFSEWPIPRKRTGPPPGTKIISEAKPIVVRPFTFQRGVRLSSEEINLQVQNCIELLASAGEHVSIERLEAMLLQKYRVNDFRQLNLKERSFGFLASAREHSMLLGKVNTYIQNFVRSRSLCTLYELGECCREFHKDKLEFSQLKLGPLQKMPIVFDLFKFPFDEYIPELTSMDIMEHLNNFIDKHNLWRVQVNLEDFMKYLTTDVHNVDMAYSLGVRLRSLPLAIQMLKKSKRDAAEARRNVISSLKDLLVVDIYTAFQKFKENILQTKGEEHELRTHYMSLGPEVAMREIFSKYELLLSILAPDHVTKQKLSWILRQFMEHILSAKLPAVLFHLSVCMSCLDINESTKEMMELELNRQQQAAVATVERVTVEAKKRPSAKALTEKITHYITICVDNGSLHLENLQKIEAKLLEEFGFVTFQEMQSGNFLDFLLTEPKLRTLLEECGGMTLGHTEVVTGYTPRKTDVLEFISQVSHAGVVQHQQMEKALCEQYAVVDVKHLGHGNISRLCATAEKLRNHGSRKRHTFFEAALCGKSCITTRIGTGQVGNQGSQSRVAAMACLTRCPLLEDLAAWSHWDLVFRPQHGPLRDFVEKHGGLQDIPLEGGRKTATSDFLALEVEPGQLLKLTSQSSPDAYAAALKSGDAVRSAGMLVSLIAFNKGLENTPLALLVSYTKTSLADLHARSQNLSSPGSPPTSESVGLAVQFVTDMLLKLPVRICVAVANQILLEPLSWIVGSLTSKKLIAEACQLPWQCQRLELLGCLLGLPEWTTELNDRRLFPPELIVEQVADDLLGGSEEDDGESASESSEEAVPDDFNMDLFDEVTNVQGDEEKEKESGTGIEDENEAFSNVPASGTKRQEKEEKKEEEEEEETGSDSEEGNSEEESEEDDEDEEDGSSDEESEASYATHELQVERNEETSQPDEREGREMTRDEKCRSIVETIRKDEFGVGVTLDETGRKLMQKQAERQGRSLQRLSKDLYSKDTHFVLELIQNADDNSYADTCPSVKFVIEHTGVTVMNNETGFEEKNIRALCDVGKSTKQKHKFGYIGQKGIGFKSVFRVTSRPEVHSNGFHICFDVDSGHMGFILPHWMDQVDPQPDDTWETKIVLPWTDEIKQNINSHATRFNDIQPSLLLFLHRLRKITVVNKVLGQEIAMCRTDLDHCQVKIDHTHGTDRWLVLRKILDASKLSIAVKSGVEVESTELALAFPLREKATLMQHSQARLSQLPVFAFLPLRSYGLRFIIQGDFDVPSSREDVNRDSSWNQWLRAAVPDLFKEAFQAFQAQPDLSPVEALVAYLQFIPLEGEVMEFFKPVTTHILNNLRAQECMPVACEGDSGNLQWAVPSKTVICRDQLIREIVSPELLQYHLGLYYLHPQVSDVVEGPLTQALGIESISTDHLLQISRFIIVNWDSMGDKVSEQVEQIAKWLACVYRTLDDFQDNSQIMSTLCNLKVIPLSCGSLVSLSDATVFLLTKTIDDHNKKNAQDPLLELKKDINVVHSQLTQTPDNEVNSQVVKLLLKMGIKQLTPQDLIYSHIVPIYQSDAWKEKSREVLISYLACIKSERERNPSGVDLEQLKPLICLATNKGIKHPATDDVHFSPAFGNKIDLFAAFPGLQWTMVDSAYLPNPPSKVDILGWRDFLSELGVVDFLRVKKVKRNFTKANMHETAWDVFKDLWPDSSDGYTITDLSCEEFHQLVTNNNRPEKLYEQMVTLYKTLDMQWDTVYHRYINTQLMSPSGDVLKAEIPTSFFVQLQSLNWLPATWTSHVINPDGLTVKSSSERALLRPHEVYVNSPAIKRLLANTVKYLNVDVNSKSSFTRSLEIKSSVSVNNIRESLISWCQRDPASPNTPCTFTASVYHITQLYAYLNENLSKKDCQDLFNDHPVIFVPIRSPHAEEVVVGQMVGRREVWWSDHMGLFTKYKESLNMYKSPLASMKIVDNLYPSSKEMFLSTMRVSLGPETIHWAQLVKHIASVYTLSVPDVLQDTLILFSQMGLELGKITEIVAGVKTQAAQLAEASLPTVLNLMEKLAVFPSKLGQWVGLGDNPMLPDSAELEEMFSGKPGVHFLQLDHQGTHAGFRRSRSRGGASNTVDQESLRHFIGLFKAIRPVSECVQTTEITVGYKPCSWGQTYLHNVVALVQRFLYYAFEDVYEEVKTKKSQGLKELQFIQVEQLEVKYELINCPAVCEIRKEKCVVNDKYFYLHKDSVSNVTDVNREVAKYFSEGNHQCIRELGSFLTQAASILDGKSNESIDELLVRQEIGELPEEEEEWEVPLPIIPVVKEPEPVEEYQEGAMVYGRALSVPHSEEKPDENQDAEDTGIKSWPPRSSVAVHSDTKSISASQSEKTALNKWPLPQAPNYSRISKNLPSTIRFEDVQEERKEGKQESVRSSEPGEQNRLSRQASDGGSQSADRGGHPRTERASGDRLEFADSEGLSGERNRDTHGLNKQSSDGDGRTMGRGHPRTGRVDDDRSDHEGFTSSVEKRKRKLTEGSQEEAFIPKRLNSQEATECRHASSMEGGTEDGAAQSENSAGNYSSSTDPAPSVSESSIETQSGRKLIHFRIPVWNEQIQNVDYTELPLPDDSAIASSKNFELSSHPQVKEIGRWGEQLVQKYFERVAETDPTIEKISWVNDAAESGLPYDFEIVYNTERPNVFIEVKSTITSNKEIFEVSVQEIKFALEKGEQFQIYRVFGAGNRGLRLLRIDNLANRMHMKHIKLYMVL